MTKSAIVLLTRKPDNIWLNFLNNIINYDIYVIIDENKYDYYKLYSSLNSKIKFVQIDDDLCKFHGYHNFVYPTKDLPNKPLAWDKAMFYFCDINTSYEKIWLIEDDVFFLNEKVIENIDNKYPNSDLLVPSHILNHSGELDSWQFWFCAKETINLPWAHSMSCACRVSNTLLRKIKEYVDHNKKLFFHELMFNTLSEQNQLIIDTPCELGTVQYNTEWNLDNLNLNNIYHPIKDYVKQLNIKMSNSIFYDNLFNNIDYQCLESFNPDSGLFLLRNYKLPYGFNFCCYRENSELKDWDDKSIVWHYFNHGKYENRKYKD